MASTTQHPLPTGLITARTFATCWRIGLVVGPLVFVLYRIGNPYIATFIWPSLVGYSELLASLGFRVLLLLAIYGPAALLLQAAFWLHQRFVPGIRFVGDISRATAVRAMVALSLLYIAAHVVALLIGQPREPLMVSLYAGMTTTQSVAYVACLMVLPPIVEELAFRHFLLSAMPFKKNRVIAIVASLLTAALFAATHTNYVYASTYGLLFGVGLVLAWVRIRTNGIALPIALHSYSIAFALVADQLVAHWFG